MSSTSPNRQVLRADARRNYDRLIAAAHAEFTQHGGAAALEDIAKRAGVGIGTLYRHFATRDDLIAAVLDENTRDIITRGQARLERDDPATQLEAWIGELVEYVTKFRGFTAALATSYVGECKTQLGAGCEMISSTGEALLERAKQAGQIREDAQIKEIILSAHAAAWIAEQTKDPGAVERLLGILFDGLRTLSPRPARKRRR